MAYREYRTHASLSNLPAAPWLLGYLGVQIGCQLLLLIPALAPFRVGFRAAAFATSLAAFAVTAGRMNVYPPRWYAFVALVVIAFGLAHPNTNTAQAAIAQILLNMAIIAPAFWVPRLKVRPTDLAAVFAVLFAFHTLSASFGILQVYYPGEFMPAMSTNITGPYAAGLKIVLADGNEIWRPMGLTDTPGGAGAAGLYAFLYGMGFLVGSKSWPIRGAAAVAMGLGLFCVYLSYARVYLVVALVASLFYAVFLTVTGRTGAAVRIVAVLPAAFLLGFFWAAALGGDRMVSRLETLVQERPEDVYYANRGRFLEETFEDKFPNYPMGMGLGRWGMMSQYFGDPNQYGSDPVWVEIQWTAWAVDGGIPLAVAYVVAVLLAVAATARVALRSPDSWLAGWAALILAYDGSILALTFSYAPFIGQMGLEFWMLNAAVYTTALYSRAKS